MHKKILMIGWEYPPHNSGGLGIACDGLTKALADQKCQVTFTLPTKNLPNVAHMQVVSCTDDDWFLENEKLWSVYDDYKSNCCTLFKTEEGNFLPCSNSRMEKLVTEYANKVSQTFGDTVGEFDVVHAHDWMSFPAGMKLKQKYSLPFIAHIHSTEHDRSPSDSGNNFIKRVEKLGLEMADKVVVVSEYTKQIIQEKYGIDGSKIEVVHNGIDPQNDLADVNLETIGGRPVVVFLGRLTAQKGADFFIQVAKQVVDKVPEALFVIAGDGDMYHSLLLQTAGKELTGKLLFAGFVRGKQKDDLLDRANVFVMPSVSEPFGLVALEAAQRKTPVIISKNSGVAEVLSGAILVDFWDINLTSDKIIDLIKDPDLVDKTLSTQNDALAQITWGDAASKMKNLYRKIFLGK